MSIATQQPHRGTYTTEPGGLLPPFVRRYDNSLGATMKQQYIRAELHRRAMEQEENQEFRNEIVNDRYREEDSRLGRAILWGTFFNAVIVGIVALIMTMLGIRIPW